MAKRLFVYFKTEYPDAKGNYILKRFGNMFKGTRILRVVDVYNIDADISDLEVSRLGKAFTDEVSQDFSTKDPFIQYPRIEVGLFPGITDNSGNVASDVAFDVIGKRIKIYHSIRYVFIPTLKADLEDISKLFFNPLIEHAFTLAPDVEHGIYLPKVNIETTPSVEFFSLKVSDDKLIHISKSRLLSLTLKEMKAIQRYFSNKKVILDRKKVGLGARITDVELEAISQTWSEHCKHKIFNADIEYVEGDTVHNISSLFKTFIAGATEQINRPYVVSVFKDNGGIIRLNDSWNIAVKVETHNAPSALDPYGGALTGVLGVQRDVLGTGIGAEPIADIDVLCFGPDNPAYVPKGCLHPKVIKEGVVRGIQDAGNKTGVPNVNGSIVYDESYVARPLVYAGTIGIMPSEINGRKTEQKIVKPGYLAVMAGGRVGKDGIHGATFSSQHIDASIPQSVVQLGDPFTQKKLIDFVLEARDMGLFEGITDNGAGGLSSSIGEMARISGGCEIYLHKVPLKYHGLKPWEILVSESQERMTLAIEPSKIDALTELAKKHDVEVSVVGKFTDSGYFHVFYKDKTVAYLGMDFLHDGVPKMKLKAKLRISKRRFANPDDRHVDIEKMIRRLISSANISTREDVVRRFDHEVKGMSIIKQYMRGPTDGAVIKPLYDSFEGIAIAHGISPHIVHDGYDMALNAFDEAVRNAISVGARFGYLAALDNFSWPDPIQSATTPDGEEKLGHLVRACYGLYNIATAYNIPFISGKDSMKNDFYEDTGEKYSIKPTLLITVVGKVDDIRKSQTPDFKSPGDLIYVLGKTYNELGGSAFYRELGGIGMPPPKVRFNEAVGLYKSLSSAIAKGIVSSVHDIGSGGFSIALAECALSGFAGVDVELTNMPHSPNAGEFALLFSESPSRFIVSIPQEKRGMFEEIMHGTNFSLVGRVRGDKRFIIREHGDIIVNEDVHTLRSLYSRVIVN